MSRRPGYYKTRYENYKAAGRCARCGGPSQGKAWCDDCNAQRNARRAERRAAGLCTSCGKAPPIVGGRLCESCRDYHRDRRKELAKADVCPECLNHLADKYKGCAACQGRKQILVTGNEYAILLNCSNPSCACCGDTTKESHRIEGFDDDGQSRAFVIWDRLGTGKTRLPINLIYLVYANSPHPQIILHHCTHKDGKRDDKAAYDSGPACTRHLTLARFEDVSQTETESKSRQDEEDAAASRGLVNLPAAKASRRRAQETTRSRKGR
jgi:hypothetical protein